MPEKTADQLNRQAEILETQAAEAAARGDEVRALELGRQAGELRQQARELANKK